MTHWGDSTGRCAACHAFGKGDRLGPDLQGVTTPRERAWLARFIAAPERRKPEPSSKSNGLSPLLASKL